jgi:hypothetical protein
VRPPSITSTAHSAVHLAPLPVADICKPNSAIITLWHLNYLTTPPQQQHQNVLQVYAKGGATADLKVKSWRPECDAVGPDEVE